MKILVTITSASWNVAYSTDGLLMSIIISDGGMRLRKGSDNSAFNGRGLSYGWSSYQSDGRSHDHSWRYARRAVVPNEDHG